MLLSLILYVSAVAAIVAVAAWSLEQALRGTRLPTRWVWIAASVSPLAAVVAFFGIPTVPGPRAVPMAEPFPQAFGPASDVALSVAPTGLTVPPGLDPYMGAIWAVLALVVAAGLTRAALVLRRERRGWTPHRIADHDVLLSEDRGPALVGVLKPRIVMPRWILALPTADQALLVRHEAEHRRAGDSRVVAGAHGLLALFPWCVPLWWIVLRLRQAIELDCDRRVLSGSTPVRPYATLLIDAAARSSIPRFPVLAFAGPTSFLERRIRAMTSPRTPGATGRVLFALLGVAAVAGACYVEQVDIRVNDSSEADQEVPTIRGEAGPAVATESDEAPFRIEVTLDGSALRGLVVDAETQLPVGGASVSIPELDIGGLTREDGRFLLLNVPPGSHTLRVEHPGLGSVAAARLLVPEVQGQSRADAGEPTSGVDAEVTLPKVEPAEEEVVARLEAERLERERELARLLPIRKLPPPPEPAARGRGTIVGTVVRTADGAPVPGAQVFIRELQIGGLTNAQGRFMLLGVPVGSQPVTVQIDGYLRETLEVVVADQETTHMSAELRSWEPGARDR